MSFSALNDFESYLKSAVVFDHHVSKVDPLPATHELSNLRVVVRADVVSHEISVQTVLSSLLLVQQEVRGWNQ